MEPTSKRNAMSKVQGYASLTDQTTAAIRDTLAGRRRGLRAVLPFAGPAFICSVAYMDPGNFATNIQAGAKYNYSLLWVVLLANAVAMLFQGLSAKLGIVTNRNLAELCRDHFPRPAVWAMWGASEVAAMATDLAEFLGGAIGLSLLFGMSLLWGMVVTAAVTYGILLFQSRGYRPIELIIGGLVGAIGLSYVIELLMAPPDWRAAGIGTVLPRLADPGALTLAVGIVGATVMPHAIYLHSSLTQDRAPARNEGERRALLRYSNIEVVVAWGVNATQALIASQGVLSLVLPVPMVALLVLMRRPEVMGIYRTGRATGIVAGVATALVLALNLLLLLQTFGVAIPGLA